MQFAMTASYRGGIARSENLPVVYSEADFEVFRPTGATRCIDGVKFGTEGPKICTQI